MSSINRLDFGSFRRNTIAAALMFLALVIGIFVGIGPLAKHSPIWPSISNQLVMLESASHLHVIYGKLERGENNKAKEYIRERLTATVDHLSQTSGLMEWNKFECDYLMKLKTLFQEGSDFSDLEKRVSDLGSEFCL